MFNKTVALSLLLASGFAVGAGVKAAANPLGAGIAGQLFLEFGADATFDADDPTAEINDGNLKVELGLDIIANRWLLMHTDLVAEPLFDPVKDRFMDDLGLFVQTLYVQIEHNNARVFAGKFNPSFGIAWDLTPGVYGPDSAKDYELTERLGFGVAYTFEGGNYGQHTLTASSFFTDTTILSNSVITKRGRVNVSDGGASNTEKLNSFAVTIEGQDIASLPNLIYAVSYVHQAAGLGNVSHENAFSAGVRKGFDLHNGRSFEVMSEIAYISHQEGSDTDATYATLGLKYGWQNWSLSGAYTLRKLQEDSAATQFNDRFLSVAAGYEFENGVGLEVGYLNGYSAGEESHTFGLRLAKAFDFDTRK